MDRPEAITLLKHCQARADLIQTSFHFGTDSSIDDVDAKIAKDFSDAIELAINSLEEDCRARREAKRFKRKYTSLLSAVKGVYYDVMNMSDDDTTQVDLVTIKSFLRERFLTYVIKKQEDTDDSSGS